MGSAVRRVGIGFATLLGILILLVVLDVFVFPGLVSSLAYGLGWLVGHIVKLFTG